VPIVEGETYYSKLTDILEVKYYDRTKYVLFNCDWANTTRDRGYKVDEYGMVLVNFINLVHTRDLITDELCVLISQVDQVYNVGQGEGPHDGCTNYHECEPLLLTRITVMIRKMTSTTSDLM